jgi:hypothetical protein
MTLSQRLGQQVFPNGYELIDGVVMHAENGEYFQIPPDVIKRHIQPGQFVELRVDSPRFSVHEDASEKCKCPACNGEMTKPILRHEHPASLIELPKQMVPSRGWGEDFWVQVREHTGKYCCGIVDNALVESRLHGIQQGDEIVFREDHVLHVHDIHRRQLVGGMNAEDLKEFVRWLGRDAE